MAPHEMHGNRSIGRTIVSVILIIIGIFVCAVSLVIGSDIYCAADIDHWMPVYPEAQLVQSDHTFFRPRASGITRQQYITEDDPNTVRRWYGEYRREITRNVSGEGGNSEVAARGISTNDLSIQQNPDGDGSLITILSECAYN